MQYVIPAASTSGAIAASTSRARRHACRRSSPSATCRCPGDPWTITRPPEVGAEFHEPPQDVDGARADTVVRARDRQARRRDEQPVQPDDLEAGAGDPPDLGARSRGQAVRVVAA
jgi:hypothetical protein